MTLRYTATMRPLSIRFSDELHERLRGYADAVGQPISTVAQLAVREWLDMVEHPGIVFRDGPTGRRAALAEGPDVWEVASVLAQQEGKPEERVQAAAEHLGLSTRQVEGVAGYWASHKVEIDQRIAANAAAADRELAAWDERRALLGA